MTSELMNTELPKSVRCVFISYAREDLEWARETARILNQVGIEVFIDIYSIRAGDKWPDKILGQINIADRVLLGWSTHSAHSEWVKREYLEALKIREENKIDGFLLIDRLDNTALLPELQSTQTEFSAITASPPTVSNWTIVSVLVAGGIWLMAGHIDRIGNIWKWPAFCWFIVGVVILYILYATPEHKRHVQRWLANAANTLNRARISTIISWTQKIHQKIYGKRIVGCKAFIRSSIISSISAFILPNVLFWIVSSKGMPALETTYNGNIAIMDPLFFGFFLTFINLILNIVSDFISVITTRHILRILDRNPSFQRFFVGIFLDTCILLLLAPIPK